jgi:hypothetical protein
MAKKKKKKTKIECERKKKCVNHNFRCEWCYYNPKAKSGNVFYSTQKS